MMLKSHSPDTADYTADRLIGEYSSDSRQDPMTGYSVIRLPDYDGLSLRNLAAQNPSHILHIHNGTAPRRTVYRGRPRNMPMWTLVPTPDGHYDLHFRSM